MYTLRPPGGHRMRIEFEIAGVVAGCREQSCQSAIGPRLANELRQSSDPVNLRASTPELMTMWPLSRKAGSSKNASLGHLLQAAKSRRQSAGKPGTSKDAVEKAVGEVGNSRARRCGSGTRSGECARVAVLTLGQSGLARRAAVGPRSYSRQLGDSERGLRQEYPSDPRSLASFWIWNGATATTDSSFLAGSPISVATQQPLSNCWSATRGILFSW